MLCDNIANLFLWTPGTGKKNSPHLLPDEELIPDCVAGEVHSEVRAAGYHLSSPPEDTIVQIRN